MKALHPREIVSADSVCIFSYGRLYKPQWEQGSVLRKMISAINRIVIFSNFLNMFSNW